MRAEFTTNSAAERLATADSGRLHGQRQHNDQDDDLRAGRGHGGAVELRFSEAAKEFFRSRHDGEDGEQERRGPREGRGHGHNLPFGRIVASFVRDGIQSLLRILGIGETSRSDDSSAAGDDTAPVAGDSETGGSATGVTATLTVSVSSGEQTAPRDESDGSADDPLTAFSQRLAQVVRQGLQTMFHLMGFGAKPEAGGNTGTTATGATTAAATSTSTDSGDAAASEADEADDRSGFPGRGHAFGRVARFLMAGFMLAVMAEGLRSLKDLFAGDGSQDADTATSTPTPPVTEVHTGTEEPARVDVAA